MAYSIRLSQYLAIDDVPLSTTAWEHLNLYALLGAATVRGENVIMPGAVGTRPVRRRPTETIHTVNLAVFGEQDWEGNDYADPIAGLVMNLAHLKANVVDPLATAKSLRTAELHFPDGVLVASIQVLGFEITESIGPGAVYASMDIAVPSGAFR